MGVISGILKLGALASVAYVGYGGLLLSGICFSMKKFDFKGFEDDSGNKTTNPFGAKWAVLELTMSVYNPSYLGATLLRYNINVTINGYPISVLTSSGTTNILPKQFNEIILKVPIDLKSSTNIAKTSNIPVLIAGKQYSQLNINLKGTVSGSAILLNKTVPFVYSYPLNLTENVQDIIDSSNQPPDLTSPCKQQNAA